MSLGEWTDEPPTESGWYWYKSGARASATVQRLRRPGKNNKLMCRRVSGWVAASDMKGQWWSQPIEEPTE